MVDYVKLRETYESHGCKLLSTEEEVNKLMEVKKKSIEYQKLRFESKCGHESEGYLVNLKYKGTGMNCRKCAYKCISVKAKGKDDKEIGMKDLLIIAGMVVFVVMMKNSQEWSRKLKPTLIFQLLVVMLLTFGILSLSKISEFLYFQF